MEEKLKEVNKKIQQATYDKNLTQKELDKLSESLKAEKAAHEVDSSPPPLSIFLVTN